MMKTQIEVMMEQLENEDLKTELENDLEIIAHKIKFMPKISAAVLGDNLQSSTSFSEILNAAGAEVPATIMEAQKLIFIQQDINIPQWIAILIQNMNPEWLAYKSNQMYLIDAAQYQLQDIKSTVTLVQDISEILYTGQFIFGGEGHRWVQFEA